MEPIARRDVVIVDKTNNQEHHIAFELMSPYPVGTSGDFMCEAKITGDINKSFCAGGVDSLQALMLAIQHLEVQFEAMKKDQYDFFWPDRSNPMNSFDLIREDIKKFSEM